MNTEAGDKHRRPVNILSVTDNDSTVQFIESCFTQKLLSRPVYDKASEYLRPLSSVWLGLEFLASNVFVHVT